MKDKQTVMDEIAKEHPEKFVPEEQVFNCIRRGYRLFVGTGCGEPKFLIGALANYLDSHPRAFFDAEVLHVWTLGVSPYTDKRFEQNFRYNSFFIGERTREAVNKGLADYTPIFLSQVPQLFRSKRIPVDVALVQTSPPDKNGCMSLGVSVDITKAAVENASIVICQVNSNMPRIHGDTFVNVRNVDYIVPHDEPLLEYKATVPDELSRSIGKYVARIVEDGDTIQVGYGSIPNAVLANLEEKQHIGVHTELVSDGIVDLMRKGVIDNSNKSFDRGRTVATFCMGTKDTYEYIDDNPNFNFRQIDETNNPLLIAQNRNMTAINSALAIDLTGQATAESIGGMFYSGIGGQADFMRGAVLAEGGKTILALPSTTADGSISRIVPYMLEGVGITLTRGDIQYVVTEYGIAYLHGKNIRERAMELIAIAHPDFRHWLIEEAKSRNLIYADQAFIQGDEGEYPEELEVHKTTREGLEIFFRPVRISDEPLLKEFFYSLSDKSIFRRFMSFIQHMPHEQLQELVAIDYTRQIVILAVLQDEEKETVVGVGQYVVIGDTNTAEASLAVRDEHQDTGIGTAMLDYLLEIAQRQGLREFLLEVLAENEPMLHLLEKKGFAIESELFQDVYYMNVTL